MRYLKLLKLTNRNKLKSRLYCSSILPDDKIRNIGILAHIDAGKTTTTERMLYYSGKTNAMGEVHHGNTVTDFMAQERDRGITICSSAVTFPWKEHRINLLDTPGHIDFTMEVEQSLGAIDGVVVVLDSSAGVEAQTVTVWHQADRYRLPRMVFANKMDRADADFDSCVNDLNKKLGCTPVPIQYPNKGGKGIKGIIDIIEMKELRFNQSTTGESYMKLPLTGDALKFAMDKRCEMIDVLSGYDDALADEIIKSESLENVTIPSVERALRKLTLNQTIVPVLLGSAYKNTGVQLLMNSVIKYLPAPSERNAAYKCFGKDFASRVFKVLHDKDKGSLTLVRVLNGTLKRGDKVTISSGSSEVVQRIYEPLADMYKEITEVKEGNIGVCGGLKKTSTGDLLVSSLKSLQWAQSKLESNNKSTKESSSGLITDQLRLAPAIPDAVYFCSIEPPSLSYQLPLEKALAELQREDPSFRVSYDENTMQTVLGGMGELHLEIIKSRILSEYKIDADLGPLQIAYKESIQDLTRDTFTLKKGIAGSVQEVSMEVTVAVDEIEKFSFDTHPDAVNNLAGVHPKYKTAVRKAALAALDRGPLIGGKVVDTHVILHNLVIGRGVAESFLMSATAQCVQKLLRQANCRLLEPIMEIQIIVPKERTSNVLSDLARRRADIKEVTIRAENNIIIAHAPLAELSGYSSHIRIITSGTASVSMQPSGYIPMTPDQEAHAIRRTQGLE